EFPSLAVWACVGTLRQYKPEAPAREAFQRVPCRVSRRQKNATSKLRLRVGKASRPRKRLGAGRPRLVAFPIVGLVDDAGVARGGEERRATDRRMERGDARGHQRLELVGRQRALVVLQRLQMVPFGFAQVAERREGAGVIGFEIERGEEEFLGLGSIAKFVVQ